ncbi:pectinesterase 2-like [Euphorbia lathyris]|uniref:pectinesterase 2-like n=1 Tax=Euphorbia lathyris TaxID=212925 RepID=UPI0033142E9F
MITAQGKQEANEDSGFSLVHCSINGDIPVWKDLGRAWMKMLQVVFAYCTMNDTIYSVAWGTFGRAPQNFLFGVYKNTGPGSVFQGRAPFAKQLDDAGAKPLLNLGYIQASKWLLTPKAGRSPMLPDSGRPFFDLSAVQPPTPSSAATYALN